MKFDNAYMEGGTLRLEKSTGEGSGYVVEVDIENFITLFSIPMYGGVERYEGAYTCVEEAVKYAESWT